MEGFPKRYTPTDTHAGTSFRESLNDSLTASPGQPAEQSPWESRIPTRLGSSSNHCGTLRPLLWVCILCLALGCAEDESSVLGDANETSLAEWGQADTVADGLGDDALPDAAAENHADHGADVLDGHDAAIDAEGPGETLTELPDASPTSLAVLPTPPYLGVGDRVRLRIEATWDDGTKQDVTAEAQWSSEPEGLISLDAEGRLVAEIEGELTLSASWLGLESEALVFPILPRAAVEGRAVWVTRWDYNSAADVETMMEALADAGFNLVYFQVRGRFDAFYASSLEPWAKELTGTLGEDPGWDPLATAILEAQARGLELHAWLNVFSFWSSGTPPASVGTPHPYELHPEWSMVDEEGEAMPLESGEYLWASPGMNEVRAWNTAVATDIVTNYPSVDGLHLDRIRYPGPAWSFDPESLAGWQQALDLEPELGFDDFRRRQVDRQVADIYDAVTELAPQVVLSAAVAANYDNPWGWGSVSIGNKDHFQDSRRWLLDGYIDVICPMAYWPLTEPKGLRTDFASLADDWLLPENAPWDGHIYMGQSADYVGLSETSAETAYVRELHGPGHALYAWAALVDHGHLAPLAAPGGPFETFALIPWMWWKAE